jgi:hypothetical protein
MNKSGESHSAISVGDVRRYYYYGDHVPVIERAIRMLKERVTSMRLTLPFIASTFISRLYLSSEIWLVKFQHDEKRKAKQYIEVLLS